MVSVKLSNTVNAQKKRLKKLPKFSFSLIDTLLKRDAVEFLKIWEEGISKRQFGLKALSEFTVASKTKKGQRKPKTPLFGEGTTEKDSYINMLEMNRNKSGKGWRVFVRTGTHHSGQQFDDLFELHEKGGTIKVKRGDKVKLIRIPPRPAFLRTFLKLLRRRRKRDTGKMVRDEMLNFIKTGQQSLKARLENESAGVS